ncbi:MAG: hypothetical protein M1812_004622 [Candelaria pacifica]|nr:MAG: hypothetical protein M1812_004622 [Candelaria pacifica]
MNDSSPPLPTAPVGKAAENTVPDTATSTTNNGSFAFLVHSQNTLPNNLPPDVDNKSLARQKRRRTSPEDQIVLEGEYARNPKPDKAARMEIVKRVALGEKEVQIWFQNRRQSTRRKSRPLSRHEILSSLHSSFGESGVEHALSSSVPPSDDYWQGSSQENAVRESEASATTLGLPTSLHDRKEAAGVPSDGGNEIDVTTYSSQVSDGPPSSQINTVTSRVSTSSYGSSFETQPTDSTSSYPGRSSHNSSLSTTGLGYISNRRNATSSFPKADDPPNMGGHPKDKASSVDAPGLKRTISQIRLSLSFDGKAQVITEDNSPPRRKPVAPTLVTQHAGLQRSQSEVGLNAITKQSQSENFLPLIRRMPSGRSRDSRAWDFYCDRDARNALSVKAEQEQSGSAVGAIGLLRSRSNGALHANFNKRNLQTSRPDAAKRIKSMATVVQKPKLGRASSSIARLQTTDATVKKQVVKGKSKVAKSGQEGVVLSNGDSDKENWEPGMQQVDLRKRRIPQTNGLRRRRILKENSTIPSQSTSLGALMSREHKETDAVSVDENKDPEEDPEVAEFMAGSGESREEDDLECVENLLSLSQGTWK